MWLAILLGAVVGLGVGAVLGNVLRRRSPLPLALVGAVVGGLLGLSYAGGRVDFPEVTAAEQFETQVLGAGQPVLVEFYTDACPACRKLAPTLNSLAGRYDGQVTFVKINAHRSRELARKYDIRAVPTVMLFVNGRIEKRWEGAMGQQRYAEALDAVIGNSKNS